MESTSKIVDSSEDAVCSCFVPASEAAAPTPFMMPEKI